MVLNFNFVSWPTVDFEYMINKRLEEQLENFALPIVYLFFIHILEVYRVDNYKIENSSGVYGGQH